MPSVEIVMAEFGPSRANNGDAKLPTDRLEPTLSSFTKWFPEATVKVYTDQDWPSTDRYEVVKVDPPFDRKHGRWGNRSNDWAQPYGLLQSKADIAIALDSDLLVVNPSVRTIIPLVEKFGIAIPSNGRRIIWRDAGSTCDGGPVTDETQGTGACRCTAFIATTQWLRNRLLLEAYCNQLISDAKDGSGARGPLSFWRAEWGTGISPYGLPAEWCITGSTCGDVEARGKTVPIVLHVGHDAVKEHYKTLVEKYQ